MDRRTTGRREDAAEGYALFATAIGACAICWGGRGILAVALPEASEARLRARLERRFPQASEAEPPAAIAAVIADIAALLAGQHRDLRDAPLDFAGLSEFEQRALALAREIGPGETATYGDLAARAGAPGAARAVGAAMAANPFPIIVPCHRVLGARGAIGGFSAPGGRDAKARLLNIERARVGGEPALFDDLGVSLDPRTRR
ncbi:MAG TPA: methylated-DNA--[protein]-cysteine S-methyltransferase [Caulobacteraceae bacterium]|nr:methylated-DNA--[protein]-cysteine S-methyltransferase [Caulobacteraceae bacterium]